MTTFYGILIPFLGTTLGAACVFFLRRALGDRLQRALTGFAAGVMVAASVWSLLIPAIDQSATLGRLSFLPAAVGYQYEYDKGGNITDIKAEVDGADPAGALRVRREAGPAQDGHPL